MAQGAGKTHLAVIPMKGIDSLKEEVAAWRRVASRKTSLEADKAGSCHNIETW